MACTLIPFASHFDQPRMARLRPTEIILILQESSQSKEQSEAWRFDQRSNETCLRNGSYGRQNLLMVCLPLVAGKSL